MQIFKSFTPEVAKLLQAGKVGVIPTDTIYGLATALLSKQAVEYVHQLKNRPPDKPLGTVLIGEVGQLEPYVKSQYLKKARTYWPGPVSVVVPTGDKFSYVDRGQQSLAVRLPASKSLREFLVHSGPLVTTSANLADQSPAATVQAAVAMFGEKVDFYVDGGNLSHHQPSKIIRLNSGKVEVLRGDTK